MSPDDRDDLVGPDPPPRERRWPGWLGWSVLAGAGLVAYELTAQPALVGLTLSLKFGLQDARTAFWLRRRDPDRRRGAAHFWLYLAHATWKVAVAGFALGVVFSVAAAAVAGGALQQFGLELFLGALWVGLIGLATSAVLTAVGVAVWLRSGRRVWLNSAVAAARVRGEWPPWCGHKNYARRLVAVNVCLALVVGGPAAAIAVALAAGAAKPGGPAGGPAVMLALAVAIGLAYGGLLLRDYVVRRVAAAHPWETWLPEPDTDGLPADRVD